MRLRLPALALALVASGCLGSGAQPAPSGQMTVTVRLGLGTHRPATHRYSLRCNPAGGTMPSSGAACAAVADYVHRRNERGGFCSGFSPIPGAKASLVGTFADQPFRLQITNMSWCGVSPSLMRDYWILSTFPARHSSSVTPVLSHTRKASPRPDASPQTPEPDVRGTVAHRCPVTCYPTRCLIPRSTAPG